MSAPEDPRLGLPSGSSALEDTLCLGRFRMQKQAEEILGEALTDASETTADNPDVLLLDHDRDAEAGVRIHAAYAGQPTDDSTHAERERAKQAHQVDNRKYYEWLESLPPSETEPPVLHVREQRWWFRDADGKPLYSGQTDALWIRGFIGGEVDVLLGDLKGLWGYHDPARINAQIRRYIALIAVDIESMGYESVRSAAAYLNQPVKTMNPPLVSYTREDIEVAIGEMQMHVFQMDQEDAPVTAGPVQCKRCKGALICPEFEAWRGSLPIMQPLDQPPTKSQLKAKLCTMSGEKLAELYPWSKALENFAELINAEVRRRLHTRPESVPGLMLKKNTARERIINVVGVLSGLQKEFGVTAQEFAARCSVTKVACEELARKRTAIVGRALEEKLDDIYAGNVESFTPSSSVVPRKEQI